MPISPVPVWFVCKLCKEAFDRVVDFIQHKRENHFIQFQNVTCVIFEETTVDFGGFALQHAQTGRNSASIEQEQSKPISIPTPPLTLTVVKEELNYDSDPDDPHNFAMQSEWRMDSSGNNSLHDLQNKDLSIIVDFKTEQNSFPSPIADSCGDGLDLANQDLAKIDEDDGMSFKSESTVEMVQDSTIANNAENLGESETERNSFVCKVCSSVFDNGVTLKGHMMTFHSELRPFKCPQISCKKAYTNSIGLKNHMEAKHNPDGVTKKFICHHCNKSFGWKYNLYQHLGAIHSDPVFKCTYENCRESFRRSLGLKSHIYMKHRKRKSSAKATHGIN